MMSSQAVSNQKSAQIPIDAPSPSNATSPRPKKPLVLRVFLSWHIAWSVFGGLFVYLAMSTSTAIPYSNAQFQYFFGMGAIHLILAVLTYKQKHLAWYASIIAMSFSILVVGLLSLDHIQDRSWEASSLSFNLAPYVVSLCLYIIVWIFSRRSPNSSGVSSIGL